MNPYLAFFVAAAVTYALRSSMTVVGDRLVRSPRLTVVAALVTPAVLAAMIAGALATEHGRVVAPSATAIASVGATFATARRGGNFGLALAVGMGVYWVIGIAGLS